MNTWVISGTGDGSLGRDIWNQKVLDLKELIFNTRKKLKDESALKAEAATKEVKVKDLVKETSDILSKSIDELDVVLADTTKMKGTATEIVGKMKEEWKKLYRWMDSMHVSAAEKLHVEAPHGRRRNLFGMLVPRNDIRAALCRRAVNAPVQGFGADVGHTAARLFDLHLHKFLRKFKQMLADCTSVPGSIECAVHDALISVPEYHLVLATLQIKHACMTYLCADWFEDYYGHHWLSYPEIETEFGYHEGDMMTWDYTQDGLRKCIQHGIQGQFDAGLFPKGVTVEDVMETAMNMPKEWKVYLDKNYPWFRERREQ